MPRSQKHDAGWTWWVRVFAAASGFLGVALGAFGAHGLRGLRPPELMAAFHTGVDYLFWHVMALLLIAEIQSRCPERGALLGWSAAAMASGIVLFSGSLFILAISERPGFGAITPIGGVAFLLGWLLLLVACFRELRQPGA